MTVMLLELILLGTFYIVRQISAQATISLEDVCGNKLVGSCPKKIALKVIGGQSSCAEKVPWNVLIELVSGPKSLDGGVYPYCGGVLITNKHVLSAAHCFWTNENPFGTCPKKFLSFSDSDCRRVRDGCPASCTRLGPDDIKVYLGVTKRTELSSADGRLIEKIDVHPGWDRTQKLNDILAGHDIALLSMKDPVDMYNRRTIPICLPHVNKDQYLLTSGRTADVTGFGVIISPRNGAKKHPVEVQTATVTLMSRNTCTNWWSTKGNQICAAGTERIETSQANLDLVSDSCNGDSGGGLTASNFDGREVLLGIISFGEPDCGRRGGKPGVYTNVLEHVEWIESKITPRVVNRPPPAITIPQLPNKGIRCLASNGKACKFPFKFRGKAFASCTTEFDPDNRAWCSTKTDSDGVHVPGEEEFGYCPSSCGINILTTPNPTFFITKTTTSSPVPSWTSWSACSVACGQGTQTRRNRACSASRTGCTTVQSRTCNLSSCQNFGGSSKWSSWGSCSAQCGGGTQIRKKTGTNIAQERGCNIQPCKNSPLSVSGPQGKTEPTFTTTWMIGGSGVGSSVESLNTRPGGNVCSREISPFPGQRTSALGGYIGGKVYVCGGSSGGFEDSVVHKDCHYAEADRPLRGWVSSPPLPMNTSHAAYTVLDGKMFAFGGYQKPVCGYRPEVQIFDTATQQWTMNQSTDPPEHFGGYACAVATEGLIFVIGGWATPETYTSDCKEDLDDDELTRINRVNNYYKNIVQIYEPSTNTWVLGPNLKARRRNHGCTLLDVEGRQGIMVAGGYNNQDGYLKSVEFLDLGKSRAVSLRDVQLGSLKWRDLPDMREVRGSKLVLINDRDSVYAVGGDLGEGRSIESFDKRRSKWTKLSKKIRRKRSFSCYIPDIGTSKAVC